MSLASLLLGQQATAKDADLDALFARTKVELPPPSAIVPSSAQVSAHSSQHAQKFSFQESSVRYLAGNCTSGLHCKEINLLTS